MRVELGWKVPPRSSAPVATASQRPAPADGWTMKTASAVAAELALYWYSIPSRTEASEPFATAAIDTASRAATLTTWR
jgi:hypothetical protein